MSQQQKHSKVGKKEVDEESVLVFVSDLSLLNTVFKAGRIRLEVMYVLLSSLWILTLSLSP